MDSAPCVRTQCNNSNPAKMSESGIWTEWTRSHVSGHSATILIQQICRNRVFEPSVLGPMCPDTVQQFSSSKYVGIGYLSHMDSGPCVRTLCHNSNPAKMSESGIWTEWTWSHVFGHCARILIQQKCRNRVFESHMDSAPCVRTLCHNSNPAKM